MASVHLPLRGSATVEIHLSRRELTALVSKVALRVHKSSTHDEPIAAVAGLVGALLDVHRIATLTQDSKLSAEIVSVLGDILVTIASLLDGRNLADALRFTTVAGAAHLAAVLTALDIAGGSKLDAGPPSQQQLRAMSNASLLVQPALGGPRLFLEFGGQGYAYMSELQHAWDMFPQVRMVVRSVVAVLRSETLRGAVVDPSLSALWCGSGSGVHLTDLEAWLETGSSAYPPDSFLRSAPVSFPLIGLTQAAGVAAATVAAGLEHPGKLVELTAGATGHSQGVVTAVAVAGTQSWESFVTRTVAACVLLLWTGARMQQVAATLSPGSPVKLPGAAGARGGDAAAAAAAAAAAGDTPSPMLAVSGLTRGELAVHVASINTAVAKAEAARIAGAAALAAAAAAMSGSTPPTAAKSPSEPAPPALSLSLVNGATACVVSGRPVHLTSLVGLLESVRAAPGLDQARVPFSQRKPVVSTRFLKVSAPFHSPLMGAAPAAILADAIASGVVVNVLTRGSLRCTVLSTADGSDLRTPSSSGGGEAPRSSSSAQGDGDDGLVLELARLQTVLPVDWLATVKPLLARTPVAVVEQHNTASVSSSRGGLTRPWAPIVLDFGPGGAGGAARLTAKCLQGAGVAVVLATAGATLGEGRVSIINSGSSSGSSGAGEAAGEEDVEGEEGGDASVVGITTTPAASAPPLELWPSVAAPSDSHWIRESLVEGSDAPDALPIHDARVLVHSSSGGGGSASAPSPLSLGAPDWVSAHGPQLVRRACDGAMLLNTAFSRLLGRPPLCIAGMTPCTSYYGVPLVAAATNAGFNAELAAGGLPRPAIFNSRLQKLAGALAPGNGISLNLLFLNARQWGFQFPLIPSLRAAGMPIESVTVAAGVPSHDNACEIVRTLKDAGLRFVAFKPGSLDAIKRVVAIAAAVAPFPIVLQWTGGRAGGHHSFEDVAAPAAATYALMRSVPSLVLVAGSGIGSGDSALPWITGTWAVSAGVSSVPMPFDGVLLASRMMVAAEAATSIEVKRLLVSTPGLSEDEQGGWEATYTAAAGGILSVTSELGEPIHKVANRGTELWREMDARFFSLPRPERPAAIAAAKDYIIQRLNADFQKPYFGRTRAGVPVDVELMTYAEVAQRMVETMFVQPGAERPDLEPAHEDATTWGRWIDVTFRDRVFRFVARAAATLTRGQTGGPVLSSATQLDPGAASRAGASSSALAKSLAALADMATRTSSGGSVRLFDNPATTIAALFESDGPLCAGSSQCLTAGDLDAWFSDCKTGGKPPPFVPCIDSELEVWFKKDSLWYSEDLAAVVDRDAGRVAILQGPIAVRHSTIVNEPAGDILKGVDAGMIAGVLRDVYGGEAKAVPQVEVLGGVFSALTTTSGSGGRGSSAGDVSSGDEEDDNSTTTLTVPLPILVKGSGAAATPASTARASAAVITVFEGTAAADSSSSSNGGGASLDFVCSAPRPLPGALDAIARALHTRAPVSSAWALALLTSSTLTQTEGTAAASASAAWRTIPNPWRRVFAPRAGRLLRVRLPSTSTSVALNGGVGGPAAVPTPRSAPSALELQVVDALTGVVLVTAALSATTVVVSVFDVVPGTRETPSPSTLTLTQHLSFNAALPFAPLCLDGEDWNRAVKSYYASLWFSAPAGAVLSQGGGGLSVLISSVDEPLRASFTLTEADLDAFASATRTPLALGQPHAAASAAAVSAAPVSFAIVAGWRALIRCLFPREVKGDILSLVHLSNSFEVITSSSSAGGGSGGGGFIVTAGDTLESCLCITEVTNGPSGKTVRVQGDLSLLSDGANAPPRPWVTVGSAFLFRGAFRDHDASFKKSPPSGVTFPSIRLATPAAVEILRSKPWFKSAAAVTGSSGGGGVDVGDTLSATLHFSERFGRGRDGSALSYARVTGVISRCARGSGASAVPAGVVGTIDFSYSASSSSFAAASEGQQLLKCNPVLPYFERVASSNSSSGGSASVLPLEGGGYTLLTTPDVVTAPDNNTAYATASRDLNPIHRHGVIADLAGLPATITHGMWTSANGARVLLAALDAEQNGGVPRKDSSGPPSLSSSRLLRSYSASFVGMVAPGDSLVTQVSHTGQHAPTGQRVLSVVTHAVRGPSGAAGPPGAIEAVLTATARAAPPPTAFVFTGQGSASAGMGQELYESSPVARSVWDAADAHLLETYGFSILHIVRANPKTLTVTFGGRRGGAIRRNYMALETEAPDGSGPVPLLPDIDESTDAHTFVHPEGLLFATQFTQPALVLVEKAAFDDMASRGLIPSPALFAGHSLGEYAALSSAVPLLPVQALVSLVFLRGMVMQGAVPRDASGRSEFGMVACNPSRVGPFFSEAAMHALVGAIAQHSKCLLEVVNFNVADRQYVVAGHLTALDIMSQALTIARREPAAAAADPAALLKRAFALTDAKRKATPEGSPLALERGEATIPLPGVDVPFHSRSLLPGVPGFRAVLKQQLDEAAFRTPGTLERMTGCYVPNLVALPFSCERYFAEEVVRVTNSPVLSALLISDESWAEAARDPAALAHLLVLELLAYQFASPVQWIATQHYFFTGQVVAPPPSTPTSTSVFPTDVASRSPALPCDPRFGDAPSGHKTVPGVQRVIEIGPALTLAGMAARTLETGRYGPLKARALLWNGKDADVIYYAGLDSAGPSAAEYAESTVAPGVRAAAAPPPKEVVAVVETPSSKAAVSAAAKPARRSAAAVAAAAVAAPPPAAPVAVAVAPPPAAPIVVVRAPAPLAAGAGAAAAPDAPLSPLEALSVIVSSKLNMPLVAVKPDATIKALVGGKSAVQNELLGDIEKEFGGGPDGAAEVPLQELSRSLAPKYKGPGKVTAALVSKMLGARMPGGFGVADVKAHLTGERMLGPQRVEGVLLHGVTMQPEGRLGSESAAKAWLDSVADAYGAARGIAVPRASTGGAAASGGGSGGAFDASMLAALLGAAATGGGGGGGGGGGAGPVPEAPLSPLEFLRALLSSKLNMPLAAVKPDATIKALVGGKSAVQNELLGDIEKEFGGGPDGGAEMPLQELSRSLAPKYGKGPGKVAGGMIAKLLGTRMPGGFGAADVKAHLASTHGLGPQRAEGVLLLGVTMQPEGRLGSESAAKAWLDSVAERYATEHGLTLGGSGGGGAAAPSTTGGSSLPPHLMAALLGGGRGGGASGGSDSAATLALHKRLGVLANDTLTAYNGFLGNDDWAARRAVEAGTLALSDAEAALALWRSEHADAGSSSGSDGAVGVYEAGIRGVFDPKKVRTYESSWAWATQDVLQLLHGTVLPALQRNSSARTGSGAPLPLDEVLSKLKLPSARARLLLNRCCAEALACAGAWDDTLAAPYASALRPLSTLLLGAATASSRRPVYVASFTPTAPSVTVRPADGKMTYAEVPRPGVPTTRAYVLEMARGAARTYLADMMAPLIQTYPGAAAGAAAAPTSGGLVASSPVPFDAADAATAATATSVPYVHLRCVDPADSGARVLDTAATREYFAALLAITSDEGDTVPLLRPATSTSSTNSGTSGGVIAPSRGGAGPAVRRSPSPGSPASPLSFAGKSALVTGCGPGSIGLEIVRALLAGGASVVATTSRFTAASTAALRRVYQASGAAGSRLVVLPYNGGSAVDTDALVAHVCRPGGLGLDLDFIIPFAAIPEGGRDVDALDGGSELAHRLMLTNVLRLIGGVARAKRDARVHSHPALALLPLSPNHGVFGGDGLYAESKLGLEALAHKAGSEGWGDFISITGAVIGWTRGTGLMAGNNATAPGIEALGTCRTFSSPEMALNLIALLHPRMVAAAAKAPVWADLRGGFAAVPDLKGVTGGLRAKLEGAASVARAVAADAAADREAAAGASASNNSTSTTTSSSASVSFNPTLVSFPPLPTDDRRAALAARCGGAFAPLAAPTPSAGKPSTPSSRLSAASLGVGLLDLDRAVVVTGYGEVCPWGNARTRWEMESTGEFSIEGVLTLAWITGKVRYSTADGGSEGGGGWVDASTGAPVAPGDVKSLYEAELLAHAGIRIVEPALFEGYDPTKKTFLHTIALDRDMGWLEVQGGAEAAEEYRAQLGGDKVDVDVDPRTGVARIRLRKGATLSVPRALRFDRWVAGQIPTGWDATRFGVPADLIGRLDPVVLYSLVAVAEALLSAGVTDPYEFFAYVHVSALGNSAGGGMGGMSSLKRIFHQRFQEADMPSDVLQESFINTVPAWINMLLLSSSGPIKTPVGACATAAESVDIAVDTITSGKASIMVVGGYDDFGEEGSYEFAQMGATSSSSAEAAAGREPSEAVRPMAPSRAGFMEAQGAGMAILMTARLAIAMGCPIYGIVALASTATDKNGRSIPAPGQGVLTSARESRGLAAGGAAAAAFLPPLLDAKYRLRRLGQEVASTDAWREEEVRAIMSEAAAAATGAVSVAATSGSSTLSAELFAAPRIAAVDAEAAMLTSSARRRWATDWWRGSVAGGGGGSSTSGGGIDSGCFVSPLRGALYTWGLTVDDITMASFHGTGTHANDVNESAVTHSQLEHLGRTPGKPVFVVAQKALTGHPKGAAAAWMLNGALQCMGSGIIPGNPNGDDIDAELRGFSHLAFVSSPINVSAGGGVSAVLLKSFGFGQAGGEILLIHPDYLLAALPASTLAWYTAAREERGRGAYRHGQAVLAGRLPLIGIKDAPPYTPSQERAVYLDPSARTRQDPVSKKWAFVDADLAPAAAAVPKQRLSSKPAKGPTAAAAGGAAADLEEAVRGATAALTDGMAAAAAVAPARSQQGDSSSSSGAAAAASVGVDVEPIATFAASAAVAQRLGGAEQQQQLSSSASVFLHRNFTPAEIAYCAAAADPASSLAGRWAAKEAVVKALTSAAAASTIKSSVSGTTPFSLRGAGAGLLDIEVLPGAPVAISSRSNNNTPASGARVTSGAPIIALHGHAATAAMAALGCATPAEAAARLRVSISHSGEYALAVAMVTATAHT